MCFAMLSEKVDEPSCEDDQDGKQPKQCRDHELHDENSNEINAKLLEPVFDLGPSPCASKAVLTRYETIVPHPLGQQPCQTVEGDIDHQHAESGVDDDVEEIEGAGIALAMLGNCVG